MQRLWKLLGIDRSERKSSRNRRSISRRRSGLEQLERREVFNADPLPVLLVIADSHHFFYQEYGDTRASLEAQGIDVVVAAKTTATSYPHVGTGEPEDGGAVTPDIALADVDPTQYSAIAFVGGWGASMYQYAFPGDYVYDHYDGDPATKAVVNDLIGAFLEQDKYVAAVCHATMILAWAEVDGESPLAGKIVSVPWIGAPAVVYEGVEYGNYGLMQFEQAIANGAIPNASSGIYGEDPIGTWDDVVVDGRIITAENQDSAAAFGAKIAELLLAEVDDEPLPPENTAPTASDALFVIDENSAAGTVVGSVTAEDADAGQTLTYAIVGGNELGGFVIDPATGVITVANAGVLNFETTPLFNLLVEVTDNGQPALSTTASITIELLDVVEGAIPGIYIIDNNLVVQGTDGDDIIYIWTGGIGQTFAWLNGVQFGPHALIGGRVIVYGGDGNDQIYATDSFAPVTIYGEGGNDQITGGYNDDVLDGGDGVDRIWGGVGNDFLFGGAGGDFLDGREGNDVIFGGDGNDYIVGNLGRDILIGGLGTDHLEGGDGDDLLIGGTTKYDNDVDALAEILATWTSPLGLAQRIAALRNGALPGGIALLLGDTVQDDAEGDVLIGGAAADWLFSSPLDRLHGVLAEDRVTSAT